MKKLLLSLILLLLPVMVFAKDTCSDKDIIIKSITVSDINGFSEEISSPTIDNNKINLDLKMFNVGDSIEYNILIKNDSNEDYYFNDKSIKLDKDYLEYTIKNDSEVIAPGEEKTVKLRVTYKKLIPNDTLDEKNGLSISLSNSPLVNPKTLASYTIFFIIMLVAVYTLFISYKNKRLNKALLLSLISFIPISVYAACNVKFDIETKIVIINKEATFDTGTNVNIKMKQLAGTAATSASTIDRNIIAIKYSETEPIDSNKEEKNVVSIPESGYPIYMWFDNGTIYWWSEDSHPNLNEQANSMFRSAYNVSDITGLERMDSSNTVSLASLFVDCANVSDIRALANWNTSKVNNMSAIFAMNYNAYQAGYPSTLVDITPLRNWDTSNVTTIQSLFSNNSSIKSLSGLENWDTSKIENMRFAFGIGSGSYNYGYPGIITDISALKNWNTSSAKDLSSLFQGQASLIDLSPIANWNTSNVEIMQATFASMLSLTSVKDLKNWDTSKVQNMSQLFLLGQGGYDMGQRSNLSDISALANWKTSNVELMGSLFANIESITSIKALENWDTSKVTSMAGLFKNCKGITDLSPLQRWDTSSVTDMSKIFDSCSGITNLNGLSNWDVSSTTNFSKASSADVAGGAFSNCTNLTDASGINNWNIKSTANFTNMFQNTPSHPTFSRVAGTWNSAGTFIPS